MRVSIHKKMSGLLSTILDPLRFVSPFAIRIKMLLQQVLKLGKQWDEPLAADLHSNLQKVLYSYFALPDIENPNWLYTSVNQKSSISFMVLSTSLQASAVALVAVSCLRIENQDGSFQTSF